MRRRSEAWRADRACKEHARPEVFVSDRPDDVVVALRSCAVCPVQDECLFDEYESITRGGHVDRNLIVGTRGNMREADRRQLWTNRRTVRGNR